jgi:hypothetical protein
MQTWKIIAAFEFAIGAQYHIHEMDSEHEPKSPDRPEIHFPPIHSAIVDFLLRTHHHQHVSHAMLSPFEH